MRLAAIVALVLAGSAQEPAPPRRLSEWGLFEGNGAGQIPAAGVRPYEVNTALFSDYASKHRLVRLPPGQSAAYAAEGPLDFPVGTVLVKTFAYPRDRRDPALGERLLETRLLVRRASGWIGLPYVWNQEQTEAVLRPGGAALDGVSWIHDDGRPRALRYLAPNMNQCKACHEATGRGRLAPLGTTAANLNRVGQLERWIKDGVLSRAPEGAVVPALPQALDSGVPLERRARAYLEVNCAHCHNPQGPAGTAGLDLRFSQEDPVKLGIGKPPVAAGPSTGGWLVDIAPGNPEHSILLHRLKSVEPGVMMPELGRKLADEEGIELIRRWIAALPGEPPK